MISNDRCSHGITWDMHCMQCELVQCYDFVQTWGPKVEKARARMHEIQKTLRRKRNKQERNTMRVAAEIGRRMQG